MRALMLQLRIASAVVVAPGDDIRIALMLAQADPARVRAIFGIGCGVITALVRLFAAAPEGVAFSILFMNMFTPRIDRYTRPQPAGGVKHALV